VRLVHPDKILRMCVYPWATGYPKIRITSM
jgi:hypothetical protein